MRHSVETIRDLARHAAEVAQQASAAAYEARVHANQLDLASFIVAADLPRDAVVSFLDWADEPNGDGTFDVTLAAAHLPGDDENIIETVSSQVWPLSSLDEWEPFLAEFSCFPAEPYRVVSVAKVYTWLDTQGA